jgi:hypothetical protein
LPPKRRPAAGEGEKPEKAPDPPQPAPVDAVELVQRLDQVDRAIVKLKYENRALSYAQIGKLLEPPISKQSVERRVNEHGLKELVAALEGDVVAKFKAHQHAAVQVVANTMTGANKSWLAFNAATFFLTSLASSKAAEPAPAPISSVDFYDPNDPAEKP